jgi:predicted N-acetyltransferase YhbS
VIRAARPSDADAVSQLLGELGYPSPAEQIPGRLARLADNPPALALVAVDGGAVVGLITAQVSQSIHAEEPIAFLTTLVVAEGHRGKGIGSRLVTRVEQWAVEQGAARVSLTSGLHRAETHAFYERRQYERTGVRFTKAIRPR